MASEFGDLTIQHENDIPIFWIYFFCATILALPLLVGSIDFLNLFKIGIEFELGSLIFVGVMFLASILFLRHSLLITYLLFKQKEHDFKNALKEHILSNLVELYGVKKSNIGFDKFLDAYTKTLRYEKLAKNYIKFIFILAFLLVMLKIVIFLSSNTEINFHSLIVQSSFIGFYAAFLSICWIVFDSFGAFKFERFVIKNKRLSGEFFWRNDELAQYMTQRMLKYFDDMKMVFDRISNKDFFDSLNDVIVSKFDLLKGFENTQKDILAHTKIGLEQNIKLLEKTALRQGEFIKVHTEILNAISRLNDSVKDLEMKLLTHYNRLNTILHTKSENLERSIDNFHSSLSKFDNSLKSFSIAIKDEQSQAMNAFRDSLIEGINAFKKAYDEELLLDIDNSSFERLETIKKDVIELEAEASKAIKNLENDTAN